MGVHKRTTWIACLGLWLASTTTLAGPPPPPEPAADPAPAQEETVEVIEDEPPEAEGAPAEAPQPEPAPEASVDAAEVDRLQGEARDLRDTLFKARARVSVLASKLFQSRVTLDLRSNLERFYAITDFTLTLDGAPVYHKESGMPSTAGTLFEAYAAPGSHELAVSATLVARRDQTYKVRVSHSFTIVVPENSAVQTRLVIRETGNMWGFAKRKRGRYRMRTRLRARAKSNEKGRKRKLSGGVTPPGGSAGGSVKAGPKAGATDDKPEAKPK